MEYYAQDELFNKHDLDNLQLKNTAVALGVFDAMHLGHLEIIDDVVKYAKENGLLSHSCFSALKVFGSVNRPFSSMICLYACCICLNFSSA